MEAANLTLVTGGRRSGKSRWAEELAGRRAPVTYLATAQAGDAEMARRIAEHRRRRDPAWRTVEEPWDVAAIVAGHREGSLLVECVTLWLTNLVVGLPGRPAVPDDEARRRVTGLIEAARTAAGPVIVVTNEVGAGVLPANALARRFADLLGEANQRLAAAAAAVYWCVAGIPLPLKGKGAGGGGRPLPIDPGA